jgi:hypothetical protein
MTLLAPAVQGAPPWFLTVVFAIHLLVFGSLLWRRRQGRYGLLVATFVLLLAAAWLPRWGVDPRVVGLRLLAVGRVGAFVLGGVALVLIVRDRVAAWRRRE